MSDEKKVSEQEGKEKKDFSAAKVVATSVYGDKPKRDFRSRGRSRGDRRQKEAPRDEFEQRILDLARVTRVMAGGKRMNFRACVAVGDQKGKVGIGLGKGADVTIAVNKAVNRAKKNLITVIIVNETIPHAVSQKTGAAKIILKPAGTGKGIIAGGVARTILELAGIKNVTSKQIGTNNKVNNARCTIEALKSLRLTPTQKDKKIANDEKNISEAVPVSE